MADNLKKCNDENLSVAVTSSETPAKSLPVLYGQRPGVALTDERADGTTTVSFKGVYLLNAEAVDDVPAADPIAAGDILYYDDAAVIKINKDATNGVRFGYADSALAGGSSGNVRVILGY